MQSLTRKPGTTIACDVLVAGGGIAGVAAAVAAARTGCRVVLIEKEAVLGGTGARGMLHTICGLYLNGKAEPTETLNGGLTREFVAALSARSPRQKPTRIGKVFVLPYTVADFQHVLAALCKTESNLTILHDVNVLAVTATDDRVMTVTADQAGQPITVLPQVVIDCTGNGDIACMAGAESDLAPPEELQLAGFIIRIRGLRESDDSLALKVPYVLARLVDDGQLSPALRLTAFAPGDTPGVGYLKFNVVGTPGPEREESVRAEAVRALKLLADQLPAFEAASVDGASQGVFEREGRRIRGEYTLTGEDVLAARKFVDGVVKNAWPIELWDRHRGPVYRYVPAGDYYEIPLRCLMVRHFSNLLVAGRCISVSHEALGSTRVMGTCLALGDQAGRAAGAFVTTGAYRVAPEEKN